MNSATGLTSPTPGSRERRPPSTSAWTRTTTTGTSPSPIMRKLLTSRRGRGTSPRSTRARTMCSRGATTASSTPAREASQNESNVLLFRLFFHTLTSNLLNWLCMILKFVFIWKIQISVEICFEMPMIRFFPLATCCVTSPTRCPMPPSTWTMCWCRPALTPVPTPACLRRPSSVNFGMNSEISQVCAVLMWI